MGLARKAAEWAEKEITKRKSESRETEDVNAVKKIGEQTGQSVYRINPRETTERTEFLEKLEASYDEMVATLTAFGFTDTPPSKTQVMEAIQKLGPAMLETIGRFGKPTVIITPKGSFESKIQAINLHRKMPGQNATFCKPGSQDKIWGGALPKMVVSIVDGIDSMPVESFITPNLIADIAKIEKYKKEFTKQKLDVMACQEGAMLMMQSLKRGQPVDDTGKTDGRTYTYYNGEHLRDKTTAIAGYWNDMMKRVDFFKVDALERYDVVRCRPSVKVMEI